jgi:carbohydrate-binding DOMON domain-containing protein
MGIPRVSFIKLYNLFSSLQCIGSYTTRRDTGRNTMPTKRVIHGPYMVAMTSFPVVYVNAADSLRSITMVVMIDLGGN